jgi:predicted DNA-binding transcriptional regulator AlpA
MLGVSDGTILRLARRDPEFPRPFRLCEGGVLLWPVPEIRAYAERKAGRAFTRAAFATA